MSSQKATRDGRLFLGVAIIRALGAATQVAFPAVSFWVAGSEASATVLTATAVANIGALAALGGYGQAAPRFVPTLGASASAFVNEARAALARRSAVITAAGLAAAAINAFVGASTATFGIAVGSIVIAPLGLTRLNEGLLRGYSQPVHASVPQPLVAPGVGTVALVALSLLGTSEPVAASCGVAVGTASGALASWILVRTRVPGTAPQAIHPQSQRWRLIARSLLIGGSGSVVLRNADILMVSLLATPTETTLYGLAARGVLLADLGLTSVNLVYAHRFAEAFSTLGRTTLRALFMSARFLSRLSTGAALGLLLVFFATPVGRNALPTTDDQLAVVLLVAAGAAASGWAGPVVTLANMTDRERTAAAATSAAAITNVVLNAALIPWMGALGAALSSAVVLISMNAFLAHSGRKYLE